FCFWPEPDQLPSDDRRMAQWFESAVGAHSLATRVVVIGSAIRLSESLCGSMTRMRTRSLCPSSPETPVLKRFPMSSQPGSRGRWISRRLQPSLQRFSPCTPQNPPPPFCERRQAISGVSLKLRLSAWASPALPFPLSVLSEHIL